MNKASAYAEHPPGNTDELVHRYLYLVKRIAHHMIARLPPHIDVDDLIQVGLIGLLDAATKYKPAQGASFETYASLRIRGAIIDDLRCNDWKPRSVQIKSRQLGEAIRHVEAKLKRPARDTEVAQHLDMDIDTYHLLLRETSVCQATDFETDELPANVDANPHYELEESGFQKDLAEKIGQLPEREKLVMSLYYQEELNLKEIGAVLNVSESRVSQIHSQAVARLRAQLGSWTSAPLHDNLD